MRLFRPNPCAPLISTSGLVAEAFCVALLAGCASTPHVKPPTLTPETTPKHAATVQFQGRAMYLERIAIGAGATLNVQLIDNQVAQQSPAKPSPSATIASETFGNLRGPPYDFNINVDQSLIKADAQYSLRVELRNADGHIEFMTPARVPAVPGRRIEFRLVRAGVH